MLTLSASGARRKFLRPNRYWLLLICIMLALDQRDFVLPAVACRVLEHGQSFIAGHKSPLPRGPAPPWVQALTHAIAPPTQRVRRSLCAPFHQARAADSRWLRGITIIEFDKQSELSLARLDPDALGAVLGVLPRNR